MHLSNGAPQKHTMEAHGTQLTRQALTEGTTILQQEKDTRRLQILEAIIIKQERPLLNVQSNDLFVIPTAWNIPVPLEGSGRPLSPGPDRDLEVELGQ